MFFTYAFVNMGMVVPPVVGVPLPPFLRRTAG
jgi:hypothetical protein